MNNRGFVVSAVLSLMILCSCGARWQETSKEGYNIITQKKGVTLGYSPASGISILECDGYAFKDLNKNGELDIYEDWRFRTSLKNRSQVVLRKELLLFVADCRMWQATS